MRWTTSTVAIAMLIGGVAIVQSPASAAVAVVVQTNAPAPVYGAVTMHGSGFAPNQFVLFKPCDVADPATGFICIDSPPFDAGVVTDATGGFDFTWPAAFAGTRWTFLQPAPGGQGAYFTPQVYDPMDQRVMIDERIPYAGGAIVTFRGEHWPPRAGLTVLHCSAGGCVHPSPTTGGVVQPTTWLDGTFAESVRLRRTVRGVDCYFARCWLSTSMGFPPTRTTDLDLVMARAGSTVVVGYFNDAREQDPFACAPVLLTKIVDRSTTVHFHTEPLDATPGVDFVNVAAGSVTIPAGQSIGCARVDLINDTIAESTEMFAVRFDSVSSGALLVDGGRTAYVFIRDDD